MSTINSESLVAITDAAAAKFNQFLADFPGNHVRLSVKEVGPNGFAYDLQVEPPPWKQDDVVTHSHGFALVVSPRDSVYLDGLKIDWETQADGTAGFRFHNPNAVGADGVARCARCSANYASRDLRIVPWWLQALAFPLTAIFVLSSVFSLKTIRRTSDYFRTGRFVTPEYLHRYCPNCIRRQIFCHWVVAVWAISFVAYLVYESLVA